MDVTKRFQTTRQVHPVKSHTDEEVTRMVRESNSIAVDVWMAQARNLRGQCEWLRAFADLSASIAELDAVMATKTTAAEFAIATQQVGSYASLTEDGKAEALEAVKQAPEEKGASISNPDDIAAVEALLEELADVSTITSYQVAAAGLAMATALAADSEHKKTQSPDAQS